MLVLAIVVGVNNPEPVPSGVLPPNGPAADTATVSASVLELANGAPGGGPVGAVGAIPVPCGMGLVRGEGSLVGSTADTFDVPAPPKVERMVEFVNIPVDDSAWGVPVPRGRLVLAGWALI
jgi:hypothetical protein